MEADSFQLPDTAKVQSHAGVELGSQVFLFPGKYPIQHGYLAAELCNHCVPAVQIADACKAIGVNLTFLVGCLRKCESFIRSSSG